MYSIKTIEIQDGNENIYYPHTDSSVVRYHNSTVKKTLDDIELTIKNLSVSSGSSIDPTLEDKIDEILGGDILVDENENVFVDEEGNTFVTSLGTGIQKIDSGELTLPLNNGIIPFTEYSTPKFRKIGNVVQVWGAIKGFADANTLTDVSFAVLPVGFRPVTDMYVLCQGSLVGKWVLGVYKNGNITAARYTEDNLSCKGTMDLTEWMPFSATFLVE